MNYLDSWQPAYFKQCLVYSHNFREPEFVLHRQLAIVQISIQTYLWTIASLRIHLRKPL